MGYGMGMGNMAMNPQAMMAMMASMGMGMGMGMNPQMMGMNPQAMGMNPQAMGSNQHTAGMNQQSAGPNQQAMGMNPQAMGMNPAMMAGMNMGNLGNMGMGNMPAFNNRLAGGIMDGSASAGADASGADDGSMHAMQGMTPGSMQGSYGMPSGYSKPSSSGAVNPDAKAWKLFLGQVSYNLLEPDLYSFFSQFGNIQELILLRQPDGRSRGCGFLIYSSQAEADAAIAGANGAVLPNDPRGRPVTVRYANVK